MTDRRSRGRPGNDSAHAITLNGGQPAREDRVGFVFTIHVRPRLKARTLNPPFCDRQHIP